MCDYVGQRVQWIKTEILTTILLLLKLKTASFSTVCQTWKVKSLRSGVTQTGTHLPGPHALVRVTQVTRKHQHYGTDARLFCFTQKATGPRGSGPFIHPTCRLVGSIHSPEGYGHSRVDLCKFRLLSGGLSPCSKFLFCLSLLRSVWRKQPAQSTQSGMATMLVRTTLPDTESRRSIVVAQVLHKVSDLHFFFFLTGAKKINRQLKV